MALDHLTKITSQSGIKTTLDYAMSDLTVDTITVRSGGGGLGGNVNAGIVTISSLTVGTIPYVGTGQSITESDNLTWDNSKVHLRNLGITSTKSLNVTGISTLATDIHVGENIAHLGDTDTKIVFTDNKIDLHANSASRLYISQHGAYLQTTFPLAFLASTGPSPAIKSGGQNNQSLLLTSGTDNPARLAVKPDGKIGIGTTNPESGQLQVIGNGYHQINISANKTADANKTGGISFLNYEGDRTSLVQTYVSNSSNTIYYGSADSSARGVQYHNFYVNASRTATTNHKLALRIESDGKIDVGGTENGYKFNIIDESNRTTTAETQLLLYAKHDGTGNTGVGFGGGIKFWGDRNGDNAEQTMGNIMCVADVNSGTTLSGALTFETSAAGVPTEKLRINSSGGVLVGTQTAYYGSGDMQHEIKKNNTRTYTAPLMTAHSHLFLHNSDTTDNCFTGLGFRAGSGDGSIGYVYRGSANNSDFVINTDGNGNGVERFRVFNGGSVLIGSLANEAAGGATSGGSARLVIDCEGLDVFAGGGAGVSTASNYGLVFANDPNTDKANGIGFFNDGGTAAGGYIVHQDKGGNNIGDLVFGTASTADSPTEKLRITSNGYVNIPNQPAFFASGALTFTDWNTYEYVTWATENYDNSGSWDGSKFTCPTGAAGDYLFQVEFLTPGAADNGNNNYILFALFKGTGGQNLWRQDWGSATNYNASFSGMVLQLAEGDEVRVALHKSYGRPYLSGYNSFTGCKIN